VTESLAGSKIGPYELVEEIGRGGMAVVYRARQPRADRDVAVKVISPAYAQYPSVARRFEEEARAAARLQHPHVLPVYDVGVERGQPYLVMAYAPGGTLSKRLADSPRPAEGDPPDPQFRTGLSLTEVVRLTAEIAAALDYAHAQGLIHCDVKPGNVLLDANGYAYLADFGIARLADGLPQPASVTPGTFAYMAPEVAAGEPPSPASDVYSLGILIYEMLVGQRPYEAHTRDAVLAASAGPPPDLLAFRPDLPPGVRVVVAQALFRSPDSRPPRAGPLALALARAAGMDLPTPAPPAVSLEPADQADGPLPAAAPERAKEPATPPPDVPGWTPPDQPIRAQGDALPGPSPVAPPAESAPTAPDDPTPLTPPQSRVQVSDPALKPAPELMSVLAWVVGLMLLITLVTLLLAVLAGMQG
jgi:serine/threonine-protein kinase